jgi:hypothetical protein
MADERGADDDVSQAVAIHVASAGYGPAALPSRAIDPEAISTIEIGELDLRRKFRPPAEYDIARPSIVQPPGRANDKVGKAVAIYIPSARYREPALVAGPFAVYPEAIPTIEIGEQDLLGQTRPAEDNIARSRILEPARPSMRSADDQVVKSITIDVTCARDRRCCANKPEAVAAFYVGEIQTGGKA